MSELISLFDINQKQDISSHMKKYGYVVIQNVLSQEECNKTTEETNQLIKQFDSRFEIFDPNTYDYMKTANNYGIFTKLPLFTSQLLRNRQKPTIIESFRSSYEMIPPLIINHDRVAFYRPTLFPGKIVYKTPYTFPNLHLDMDPQIYLEHHYIHGKMFQRLNYKDTLRDFISENNYLISQHQPIYQGLVSIWNNNYKDGGLHLVPGFHNNIMD